MATPLLLQQCCPTASGGTFGYPGGACPVAGITANVSNQIQYDSDGLGGYIATDLGDTGIVQSISPTVLPGCLGYYTNSVIATPTCYHLFTGMNYKLTVFQEKYTLDTGEEGGAGGTPAESVFTSITFTANAATQTLAPFALPLDYGYYYYISRMVVEWVP